MKGAIHTSQRHDSALKHVTGQALYIDDMPEPAGTLHAALVLSPIAHGRLKNGRGAAMRRASSPCSAPRTFPAGTTSLPSAATSRCSRRTASPMPASPLAMVVATTLDAARHAADRATIEIDA